MGFIYGSGPKKSKKNIDWDEDDDSNEEEYWEDYDDNDWDDYEEEINIEDYVY